MRLLWPLLLLSLRCCSSNDDDEVKAALTYLVDGPPASSELTVAAVEDACAELSGLISRGDLPPATGSAAAERAASLGAEEAAAVLLNNVALQCGALYGGSADCDRRESYARAHGLAPALAEIALNFAYFLEQSDEVEAARGVLLATQARRKEKSLPDDAGVEIFRASLCGPHSATTDDLRPRYERLLQELDLANVTIISERDPSRLVGSLPIAWPYLGFPMLPLTSRLARLYDRALPPPTVFPVSMVKRRLLVVAEVGHNTSPGLLFEAVFEGLCLHFEVFIAAPPSLETPFLTIARRAARGVVELDAASTANSARAVADSRPQIVLYLALGLSPVTYALARLRLAPVQLTFGHGHPISSGLQEIDFFVSSDQFQTPDDFSEQVVLFDSLTTGMRRPPKISRLSRAELGLPQEGTLYSCLQHSKKLHPDFDAVLAGILERDPTAHILLLQGARKHILRRRTDLKGLVFLERMDRARLLAVLAASDVALDTFPWGGGVTSLEAFSLCVPVVILPSKTTVLQLALGQIELLGLTELVATDIDHYVEIATSIGTDATKRFALKSRICDEAHKLFDPTHATKEWISFLDRLGSSH